MLPVTGLFNSTCGPLPSLAAIVATAFIFYYNSNFYYNFLYSFNPPDFCCRIPLYLRSYVLSPLCVEAALEASL